MSISRINYIFPLRGKSVTFIQRVRQRLITSFYLFPSKNLEATLLFVNFSKTSDSIHRGKIKQIRLAYDLSKETVSHSTNTLGKGMNPIILLPAMGKIVGQTGFFSLGEATSLGGGNSEFKPVKLCLKIDIVSYPARAEGLINMVNQTKNYVLRNISGTKFEVKILLFSTTFPRLAIVQDRKLRRAMFGASFFAPCLCRMSRGVSK